MSEIVIISGSPSVHSRTDQLLKYLEEVLTQHHLSVKQISVKDISAEDLMFGNFNSAIIKGIVNSLRNARGVIVGSPVYKASYSGVLKALFDVLPQDILNEKPVLPIMTGGSPAHMLAIDYALNPLLSTLKGEPLKGLYFLDEQLDVKYPILDEKMLERTKSQLNDFTERVS